MKWKKYFILVLLSFLFACEEKIEMSFSQPIPLVYCLFDLNDSIHQVVLTKTVCGLEDTRRMAKISDSLYYNEAQIYFEYRYKQKTIRVYLEKKLLTGKEPGLFLNPDYIVYQTTTSIPWIEEIGLYVEIPGQPIVSSVINVMKEEDENLVSPYRSGVTIYLDTTASWKIKLAHNRGWNFYREVYVELDIIEINMSGEEEIKTIYFNKNRYPEENKPKFIALTWDLLINSILEGIEEDSRVFMRRFGEIRLQLFKGDPYYEQYIKSFESFNDFSLSQHYTNITNGIGLFSSRFSISRDRTPI